MENGFTYDAELFSSVVNKISLACSSLDEKFADFNLGKSITSEYEKSQEVISICNNLLNVIDVLIDLKDASSSTLSLMLDNPEYSENMQDMNTQSDITSATIPMVASQTPLEQYLSSISEDKDKCLKVRNLRGVLDELGTTSVHTVMGWQTVTAEGTNQVMLRDAVYPNFDKYSSEYYDEDGFAKIGDRYVVATTIYYGSPGDYIDIEQEDGSVIHAIIGDVKNTEDSGANKYGHDDGKCVVEFVVDCNKWYEDDWDTAKVGERKWNREHTPNELHPEWNQNVVEIRNLGNYDDYADQFGYEKAGLSRFDFIE